VNVDLEDGCCRECGGQLKVVGSDDCTLSVECECGEAYDVETDAFGDGCMKYYVPLQIQQLQEEGDGPDRRPD
jgi:hypothetical protein